MNFFSEWKRDLSASIVVFFVAVPLCLGIALASGAPLVSGIVAGIVGGLVVGLISHSPLGVSGPAAGLAVIVLNAIGELGFQAFLVAVVVAGVFQVFMGLAKSGVLAYFFPTSVIKGMLAGIGIIIILKQIPHAFGHDSDPVGDMEFQQLDGDTTLSAFESMIGDLSPTSILVSMTCLAILILWETKLTRRGGFFKLVQGPIAAVAFAAAYQALTTLYAPNWAISPEHLVSVPVASSFGELRDMLAGPDWSAIGNASVWVTGITMAIVASLETLLCVEATDKLDPLKRVTPTNRELIAQGVGNVSSGLLGGLPVTQVIVRSSANIQSGGRTRLSTVLHGSFLLVSLLALPELLNQIPLAALASILFVVGYKLAKPTLFRQMYAQGAVQFVPFLTTIVAIVFSDLLIGIGLGMVVAIFALLHSHYKNSHFLHLQETDSASGRHEVRMELAEEVTFLNKGAIRRELGAVPDGSRVIIDASQTVYIDQDVREIIEDFEDTADRRGIEVIRNGDFTAGLRARANPEPRTPSRPAEPAAAATSA